MTEPDPSSRVDLDEEVERLRTEGLNQAQARDDERREALRLKSIAERYRSQADDLSAALVELNSHFEAAAGQVQYLSRRLGDQEQRAKSLVSALEEFGQHARGCRYKPKKAESVCNCGLRDAVRGVQEPLVDAADEPTADQEPRNGQ